MKYIITAILLLAISATNASAQCNCWGGTIFGGFSPAASITNTGVIKERYISASLMTKTMSGDTYYHNGSAVDTSLRYSDFNAQYSLLNISYGLADRFMADLETGYYLNREFTDGSGTTKASGFSHIGISGKYIFYLKPKYDIEFSGGVGVKFPLGDNDNNSEDIAIYQRTAVASRAVTFNAFFHKGFPFGLHLYAVSRFELTGENDDEYRFGNNITSSVFVSYPIIEKLTGILEIQHTNRTHDYQSGKAVDNTGGNFILISPQINYSYDNFNFAAFTDIPILRYPNGYQLGLAYSLGINIGYYFKL
jgi:hypothetical protein